MCCHNVCELVTGKCACAVMTFVNLFQGNVCLCCCDVCELVSGKCACAVVTFVNLFQGNARVLS